MGQVSNRLRVSRATVYRALAAGQMQAPTPQSLGESRGRELRSGRRDGGILLRIGEPSIKNQQ